MDEQTTRPEPSSTAPQKAQLRPKKRPDQRVEHEARVFAVDVGSRHGLRRIGRRSLRDRDNGGGGVGGDYG
jgi:hypothetical protein